jgi:hypothetical protein
VSAAKIFIGYGYNARDRWIEEHVFPILETMDFQLLHGKDMHGDVLQDGVRARIQQCDSLLGFCTLRESQRGDAFNTHPWVRDEIVYALALGKPVIELREDGVNEIQGLVGPRQYIKIDPASPLTCLSELLAAVKRLRLIKLHLVSDDEQLLRAVARATAAPGFEASYRTRVNGVDSPPRAARVERVKGGIFMYAPSVPDDGLIEVRGKLDGAVLFTSDWEGADSIRINVI